MPWKRWHFPSSLLSQSQAIRKPPEAMNQKCCSQQADKSLKCPISNVHPFCLNPRSFGGTTEALLWLLVSSKLLFFISLVLGQVKLCCHDTG